MNVLYALCGVFLLAVATVQDSGAPRGVWVIAGGVFLILSKLDSIQSELQKEDE